MLSSTRLRILALAALLSSVAAAKEPSQDQSAQSQVLHVKSNLVILDVVVTDKQGHVVPDLKKEDFIVYENGVRQTVRTLDSPATRPPLPAEPVLDRNGHATWGEAPLTLIVLDQLNTPIEEIAYVREQLFKYLAAQPAQLPEPTSLIVLNDSGIQNAIPATRDRDALLNTAHHLHVALPFRLKRAAQSELLMESFALLRQIALSTSGDKGRKNVIWVGRGFPSLDPQALDPHAQELFLKAVRSTVDLLLASRVTLSKIDPRTNLAAPEDGDSSDPATPSLGEVDDPFATTFSFGAFIAQTGGKNFMYMDDLAREIEEGVSQGSNFYTLSYVPTDAREDGKYRKLVIRVARPGVVVRTKEGFYAGAPKEQPSDRELGFDMLQAAVSDMQYSGVGIRIADRHWDEATDKLQVKVTVDTGSVSFEPTPSGAEQATLYVALAALDEKAKVLSFKTVSPRIEIPANEVSLIPTGHTSVSAVLSLPRRTAAVRVIVRDGNGRIGTADVGSAFLAGLAARPVKSRTKPDTSSK